MHDPTPRQVCARIVARWLASGDFPDRLIPEQTPQRALVQEIVYGTVRRYRTLTWMLEKLASRDPDPQAKAYLLIGLYQLFTMDNIPVHAALNETVEASKADLDPARVRFVNGLLRNALRRQAAILEDLSGAEAGIRHSHPDILINRWAAHYGATQADALCAWNNRRPDVTLRVDAGSHPDAMALRQTLTPHPACPEHYSRLPPGTRITDLPGFETGRFFVQDPAANLSISLLDPVPGCRLLDACAAPGGKAFACAALMRDEGVIIAADLHEDRLKRLRENARRMRLACVRVVQADARAVPAPESVRGEAPFNRILLDVPCSNTGVLARRPDARWRFTPARLEALVYTQRQMLDAAACLLAPGGIMVYSTCSLEPEENQQQVENWLAQNPRFRAGAHRLCFPPESGTDGAFAMQLINIAD